jgi:hypothetical protein
MRSSGAPGADGLSWKQYRHGLHDRIDDLSRRLSHHRWQPGPLREEQLELTDKSLSMVIPTVEDRIVHRALRHCVEPVLEAAAYHDWVYGWRPRRDRVDALTHAATMILSRPWVADLDVAAATAGATLEDTIDGVARYVSDGSVLAVLRSALAALPQPLAPGSGLTPMLTNLRLVPADGHLADLSVLRVTDNYAVLTADEGSAAHAFARVTDALAASGLRANPRKSKIWRPNAEDLFLAG